MRQIKKISSFLVIFLLAFTIISFFIHAQEKNNTVVQAAPAASTLERLTNQLRFVRESNGQSFSANQIQSYLTTASQRRQLLSDELKNGTTTNFVFNLMTTLEVATLPKDLKQSSFVEKPITVKGKLEILHFDDFEHNKGQTKYFLVNDDKRYELKTITLPDVKTGTMLKVTGMLVDNTIGVNPNDQQAGQQVISQTVNSTTGDQKTLVMLVKFQDLATEPTDATTVNNMMFAASNSVNAYYKETSYQQASFSGRTVGWYTIPSNNTGCDYTTWADQADAAALAQLGATEFNSYPRRVYMLNGIAQCPWGGLGSIGGSPSKAWINNHILHTYIHELGHNLGADHAGSLDCNGKSIDSNCNLFEYGNRYDVMGQDIGQMSAAHKFELGWINPQNMQTLTSLNNTINIPPLETQNTQYYRFLKPDSGQYYYPEYRLPIGYDNIIITTPTTLLNAWTHEADDKTYLLDLHPQTSFPTDEGLNDGESFYDQLNNITVRQSTHSSSNATLSVSLNDYNKTSRIYPWQSATLPIPLRQTLTVSAQGNIYIIKGYSASSNISATYVSHPDPTTGVPGSWSQTVALPTGYQTFFGSSYGNRLYVLATDINTIRTKILMSTVNPDNSLTAWQDSGAQIQNSAIPISANAYGVYALNPYSNGALYLFRYNSDGTLQSTPNIYSNIPSSPSTINLVENNNILYAAGISGFRPFIFHTSLSSDGTPASWVADTNLPPYALGYGGIALLNSMFIWPGGRQVTNPNAAFFNPVSLVYHAAISANGTVQPFTEGFLLPKMVGDQAVISLNSYVYVIGGTDDTANISDQIFYTSIRPTPTPTSMPTPTGYAYIAGGGVHNCAVTTAGSAKCWGLNTSGQLGNGTTTDSTEPVQVTGLTSAVSKMSGGTYHTCTVTTAGGVKCWGANGSGQLGNGSTVMSTVPVNVTGLTNGVSNVMTGGYFSCAVTTTGGVKCWGKNTSGQLGNGTTTDSAVPVQVTGLTSGISSITAGAAHTCVLTTAGGVKCWGSNTAGQLGNGTTTSSSVPVNVTGLTSGVSKISGGGLHTCAVTTAGAVKCWGLNVYGQLGNGTTTASNIPVQVTGLTSGMSNVMGGAYHTCALSSAGGVKCWGVNASGQLGNGTTTLSSVPVQVSGLTSGVSSLAGVGNYSCAGTTVKSIKCWGDNTYGQLGIGSTTNSSIPITVIGP